LQPAAPPGIPSGLRVRRPARSDERAFKWHVAHQSRSCLGDMERSFANPCWVRHHRPDGSVTDRGLEGPDTWYVDLGTVEQEGNKYTFRDLYIDLVVPMDVRHYRMLDLDEFADAIDAGSLNIGQATNALRRWQWFLDRRSAHPSRRRLTSRRPRSFPCSNCRHFVASGRGPGRPVYSTRRGNAVRDGYPSLRRT
jgi:hypothetical protein